MKYAPVLIPTLNRYIHFKRCVESLSKNVDADKTHLFIALDAPKNKLHEEGYHKIKKYLDTLSSFKELTIISRVSNLGPVKNIETARREIFNKYDRIILSEDDNEFSPNFLNYINNGLTTYERNNEIFAICGYNYPIDIPTGYMDNVYIWKGISAWGYGVWREKFNKVNFSIREVNDFLKSPFNIRKLNKYAGHYLPYLFSIIKNKSLTGDTIICMYLVKNNMYCIFPVVSKVRNFGHDGSGFHCDATPNDIYSIQAIDLNDKFEYYNTNVKENKGINRVLKEHFKLSWKGNIRSALNYFKFILKLL